MQNIKSGIVKYMLLITTAIVILLLCVFLMLQLYSENRAAREEAGLMFLQIEQVLSENNNEIDKLKEEYIDSSLKNAETIAYMLQYNPDAIKNIDTLKSMASLVGVDEIHIFDTNGKIVSGTHPEYYGYTFDSGEQMHFFKPLLTDRSLRLCQDITPNTAEGKLMQYSALWSENGEFIVEIGMEPVNVMRFTTKNELSYIFSLLRAGAGVSLYAINTNSHIIMGSTHPDKVGKNMVDIGFVADDIAESEHYRRARIDGIDSYCIFSIIDGDLIAYVIPNRILYSRLPQNILVLVAALLFIAAILVSAVTWYMSRHVIDSIHSINSALTEITNGDLEKYVDINGNAEFTELSSHINDMIRSLLANTDKISTILNQVNSRIGVYEYNINSKSVKFTDYIPEILGLDEQDIQRLKSDHRLFRGYIDTLRSNLVPGETSIYQLDSNEDLYIKIDETINNNDVFGIIVDITDEIVTRRRIESERDVDLLTGLLNRRGINSKLQELFGKPEKLKYGAIIMIDADDLKLINDNYGHNKGDAYLRRISELISGFGAAENLSSRLGGDEFVTLLYGYENEKELYDDLQRFMELQDGMVMRLGDNISAHIRFSAGYSLIYGKDNYHMMLRAADEMMYENKRRRKNPKLWASLKN